MKIEANREVCVSAGMCALSAPEVFDQDDDGIVELLVVEVPVEHADSATRAVAVCPSGALRHVELPEGD
ncbi:(4Fe-4S)-binding protein [Saccharopolyspora shandongensis]|uniref:ferredoxin n=1 Tax=Saccharopolyspora shandongensis TaxID=418495 RepID=UPI00340AC180